MIRDKRNATNNTEKNKKGLKWFDQWDWSRRSYSISGYQQGRGNEEDWEYAIDLGKSRAHGRGCHRSASLEIRNGFAHLPV